MNLNSEKVSTFGQLSANNSEVVAAFFVLAVIFMMILPLPTWLIDILIALNMCIAALLVIFSMYIPGPLAFSTFPGVLLLTTLFRLALSISTTRMILLQADAGDIVQTFGEFVVGGELIVGLVIFLIITVVQFVVITKGSERVAEVAARFSLDAMPGKQLAIDSDLRSGLLEADDASKLRENLSRENQLYGAMDGALKFVKGDAIAGLVIVAVNLLGGLTVGIANRGMSTSEAISVYSVLTIGDGLVAQIPALLISLTAGMIVTRVSTENISSNEDNGSVGKDIAKQILDQPRAWIMSSAAMLTFAVIPGMPTLSFLFLSLLTGFVGFTRFIAQKKILETEEQARQENPFADFESEVNSGQVDIQAFLPVTEYSVHIAKQFANPNSALSIENNIRKTRNQIVSSLGMLLPDIIMKTESAMPLNSFVFNVNETPLFSSVYAANAIVVPSSCKQSLTEILVNFNEEKDFNPDRVLLEDLVNNVCWLPARFAELLQKHSFAFLVGDDYIKSLIGSLFLRTAPQFIGINEAHRFNNDLETTNPELAKELQRSLSMVVMADVMRNLATESVPMRALRQISETLIRFSQTSQDAMFLAEQVRFALRFQICHNIGVNNLLKIITLHSSFSGAFIKAAEAASEEGHSTLSINTSYLTQKLVKYLKKILSNSQNMAIDLAQDFNERTYSNIVIVVPDTLRRYIREALLRDFYHLPVLSERELITEIKIEKLAELSLSPNEYTPASSIEDPSVPA